VSDGRPVIDPILRTTIDVAGQLLGAVAALHALLFKRDPRSALGWIAVCVLFPWVGAVLYGLLGVNRLRTHGAALRARWPDLAAHRARPGPDPAALGHIPPELSEVRRTGDAVSRQPLTHGNRIEPLHGGEQAYPAMRQAIANATTSVRLCSYIFDMGEQGRAFVDALADATARGVDVQVLVDGIGEKYSWPRARRALVRRGVRVARFLPPSLFRPNLHMNLRNHRKLLVVDGKLGFTGGMNIGARHMMQSGDRRRVVDIHFRVTGPVVHQLEDAFHEDWCFATGQPPDPLPPSDLPAVGDALCRGITDGPNEDLDALSWILRGAFAAAQRRILIMTPYFVPDRTLVADLIGAALRGVEVEILLPGKNNLPFVHWATRAMLWELLEAGVRVHYQPPPFVHSKLLLVDDDYALIGSANIDPRSLRLNFEFNVEVWDRAFVADMGAHVAAARAASREVTLEELDGRHIPERIRDGLARLAAPYL
jgi:cardiolipin synthase